MAARAPHNIQECRGLRVGGRTRSVESNRRVGRCLERNRGGAHGDVRAIAIIIDSDRMLSVEFVKSRMMIKNTNQVILIYEKNLPARKAVLLVRQKESG